MADKVKITLVKSLIGRTGKQKATAKALGLSRIGSTVEKTSNPQINGMIAKVEHLVKVEQA